MYSYSGNFIVCGGAAQNQKSFHFMFGAEYLSKTDNDGGWPMYGSGFWDEREVNGVFVFSKSTAVSSLSLSFAQ